MLSEDGAGGPWLPRTVLEALTDLDAQLGRELAPRMARVGHHRMRRLARHLREIHGLATAPPAVGRPEVLQQDASWHALLGAQDLVDELGETGVLSFFQEHGRRVARLVHRETLPVPDGVLGEVEVVDALIREAGAHPDAIEDLSPASVWRVKRARWSAEAPTPAEGALADTALGAAFAAACISTTATLGVFAALPSLGIGTVTPTVGAATGCFAGLVRLRRGLDRFAGPSTN